MQITICDDEKEARELIGKKVRISYPEADIFFCESGEKLLLLDKQIDILFLDIHMPGKNGMETARELRRNNIKAILIFVTALEEYVFQAFDVGAFHYLVKPFTDEKFETVLHHAVEQYQTSIFHGPEKEEKYIVIRVGGVHTRVFLKDIVYVEVFNRKVIIHKVSGKLEFYGKLSELEKQLGEDFFRPHRAYLINFRFVEKYDASVIYLEKGKALIAKQNYAKFVKGYLKYNQRKGKRV